MTPARSVVVFVGPSLAAADAAAMLPDARVEPPIRRGDLYRARNDGASVLLIIDGQFLHEEALPVREVVDVARDGAAVFGAASMGALRAAECGPVGVRGIGLAYRLFRTGYLESDDEVAVATDPDDGFRATSLPLLTVRVAMRRATRAGLVEGPAAAAIVQRARRLFYSERSWALLLRGADSRLVNFCAGIDVKADDARKLLRSVALAIHDDPTFGPRHGRSVDAPSLAERERQRLPDPFAGGGRAEAAADLARWLVGSGRHRLGRVPLTFTPVGTWAPMTVDDPGFAKWLWDDLAVSGDLEAEVMRQRVVALAAAEVAARGLRPRAVDRYLAEAEIMARYRCTSWGELRRVADNDGVPSAWVEEAAGRLALARRRRSELFAPGGTGRESTVSPSAVARPRPRRG